MTDLGAAAPLIRPARPDEAALILTLLRELADYEGLLHEARMTEAQVREVLFGPAPRAHCDLVELEGEPVGLALWHYNLSTFEGRHGIWLEDLYVRPAARGRGAGLALMAHLAGRCRAEELPRLEWAVLRDNAPAIAFYDALGATAKEAWITRQLRGPALEALAKR